MNKQRLAHLLVKKPIFRAARGVVQWSDDIINREALLHADEPHRLPAIKKLRWNICWPKGSQPGCSFIRSRCIMV